MGILNLSKLAQVKMKFTSAILIVSRRASLEQIGVQVAASVDMEMEVTGEITGDGEEHLTVLKHASPQSFRLNPPPGLALVHLKRSLTIALPQPVQQQQLSMRALPV